VEKVHVPPGVCHVKLELVLLSFLDPRFVESVYQQFILGIVLEQCPSVIYVSLVFADTRQIIPDGELQETGAGQVFPGTTVQRDDCRGSGIGHHREFPEIQDRGGDHPVLVDPA
jgi:hypothetical protein